MCFLFAIKEGGPLISTAPEGRLQVFFWILQVFFLDSYRRARSSWVSVKQSYNIKFSSRSSSSFDSVEAVSPTGSENISPLTELGNSISNTKSLVILPIVLQQDNANDECGTKTETLPKKRTCVRAIREQPIHQI